MARSFKVFTLGIYGFITRPIGDALGLAAHVRQATVLAVAPTKAEAVRVLAERGFSGVTVRDPEFRQATGNDVDALQAGGLLAEPGVVVIPGFGNRANGVVRMQAGGVPQRVGRLENGDGYGSVYVPEEQA